MAAAPKRVREQDFPFAYERSTSDGDGLTFEGYAAVFNSPTRIQDSDGEYDEVIMPGAFRQTIRSKPPILMYNHGKHPMIGDYPLGTIKELREDARGLFVRARLTDNWLVSPVRDAVANDAITGMSFRFEPIQQDWSGKATAKCRYGEVRKLREVRCPELGPVVSPAYADTTAAVRSCFRGLEQTIPGIIQVQLLERDGLEVDTDAASPQDAVEEAIENLWGLSDYNSDVYVQDFRDDAVVFYVFGADQSEYAGLWRVDYTNDNGTINLGTPQRVKASGYVSIGSEPPKDLGQWDSNLNSAPIEGEERADTPAKPYGDVTYADPGYQKDKKKRYPIDTMEHAKAAWSYINQADNASQYSPEDLAKVKARIMAACKKFGVDVTGKNSQDISTSDELAIDGTSEELAATQARTGPITQAERRQALRKIQLERRK